MWQVSGVYVIDERFDVRFRSARVQFVAPLVQVDLAVVKDHLAAVHDTAYAQVNTALSAELLDTSSELIEKCATDESGADHSDRKRLARKVKSGVQRSQCLGRFLLFDDGGDIALRRSLRDRSYVDTCFAECTEELPGNAKLLDHSIAHHRNDAASLSYVYCLHLASLYLREECFLDGFLREVRLRTRHGETDRMFRARLRDHHD